MPLVIWSYEESKILHDYIIENTNLEEKDILDIYCHPKRLIGDNLFFVMYADILMIGLDFNYSDEDDRFILGKILSSRNNNQLKTVSAIDVNSHDKKILDEFFKNFKVEGEIK